MHYPPKYFLLFILAALLIGQAKAQNFANQKVGRIPRPETRLKTATPVSFSINKLFTNNMVIQRDKPFIFSGQAPPNVKINVKVSWKHRKFKTTVDSTGNWKVSIPVGGAEDKPQTITAKADGFDEVVVSNILIGDVWLCSGQSNMAMPLDSIAPFKGVICYHDEIASADNPGIRILDMQDKKNAPPEKPNLSTTWSICSPATIGRVSAVAYYFADKVQHSLNIPIGIIIAAVNGSLCQSWANIESIKGDPVLSAHYLGGCSNLYNTLIDPLTALSIKGFIWYQGESNKNDPPANYTRLSCALINGWRNKFNQPDLPFYYVQLSPFDENYNRANRGSNTNANYYAKFREAQAQIRKVNGTEMAITMDVGEPGNHHPRNKKPVGERLALLALKNTYKKKVQCSGPQFESFTAVADTVTITYANGTADGLTVSNNEPLSQFFSVAGTDHQFRLGTAMIHGNTIQIIAPAGTPLPILAVRYAFTNAPLTNLQNASGLPAEPFRTDNWDN